MDISKVQFGEVKVGEVGNRTVADVNRLRQQYQAGVRLLDTYHIRRALAAGARLFVGVNLGSIVAGLLVTRTVTFDRHEWWIERVWLDRYFRAPEILSNLLDVAEGAAQQAGCTGINFMGTSGSTAVRSVYSNRGYENQDREIFRLEL